LSLTAHGANNRRSRGISRWQHVHFSHGGLRRLLTASICFLTLTSTACRLPPRPEVSDLSSGWFRRESVAVRAAEQLSEKRHFPEEHQVAASDCDDRMEMQPIEELSEMNAVVAEVLRVNHNFEAAEAAWMAAMELYPQATSWKDPNLRFQNGPTIFGASQGAHLWRLQVSQELPWFGKSGLRGEMADRSADVAHFQWRQMRQSLVSLARKTYLNYVQSEQLYQLQHQDYQLAKVALEPPATIAQASWDLATIEKRETYELEILQLEQQQQEFINARSRAREQLNALLHRELDATLPPATVSANQSPLNLEQLNLEQLEAQALHQSPELLIAKHREKQAEAARQLAEKDFYPDVKIVGRFDTNASHFWAPDTVSIRPQLGIYLDPPIQQRRRWARLREQELTLRRRRAETLAVETNLRTDIQRLVADMQRSQQRVETLDRLVAAAERKAGATRTLVSARENGSSKYLAAKRTVIQYQMKKLSQEFELLQKHNDLFALLGSDGWSGSEITAGANEWAPILPF
jgi:outer membrane protein, heavy metal efflux system